MKLSLTLNIERARSSAGGVRPICSSHFSDLKPTLINKRWLDSGPTVDFTPGTFANNYGLEAKAEAFDATNRNSVKFVAASSHARL